MYNDRELLAKTLMAEAGNQGPLGMLAAGSVIMNRVRSGNYGQGLQGVILKPGAFSPWNSVTGFAGGEQGQDMARITPSEQAYRIADALLSGQYEDPTGNATHFYNPDISDPSWGIRGGNEWRRIGEHVFGRADDRVKGPSRVINVGSDAPKLVASDTMAALGKGGGAVTPDQIAQAAQAQSTGMQGQQQPRGLLGGFFSNPDNLAALAIALNSMCLNPDPALAALLTGRMKERRAERQTEAQKNRTVEVLKKIGADPKLVQLAEAGFGSEAMRAALAQPKDDRTALQKNYEYAIQMGMTPEQARTWVSSGTTVNVGGQQSQQFGDAPTGTVWAYDEQGRHVMEQGPGGVMRPKVVPLGGTEAEKRAAGIAGQKTQSADAAARAEDSMRLIESIINDPALPQITGMVQGRLPAFTQSGTDLMAKIEQVQGQAFLQAFESLKGGGQITEREGIAAQNAMARLQRTQSTEAMKQSLQELYDIMGRGRRRAMGQNVPEYTGASGGFSVTGKVD